MDKSVQKVFTLERFLNSFERFGEHFISSEQTAEMAKNSLLVSVVNLQQPCFFKMLW